MSDEQEVLLVNGIPETEQVLKAVFETRGHRVRRVRAQNGQGVDEATRPRVVVVDADETDAQTFQQLPAVPRVVVGEARVVAQRLPVPEDTLFLEKPFQYPELVRLIEQLISPSD